MNIRRVAWRFVLLGSLGALPGCGAASDTSNNLRTITITPQMQEQWAKDEAKIQEKRAEIARSKGEDISAATVPSDGRIPLGPGAEAREAARAKRSAKKR